MLVPSYLKFSTPVEVPNSAFVLCRFKYASASLIKSPDFVNISEYCSVSIFNLYSKILSTSSESSPTSSEYE